MKSKISLITLGVKDLEQAIKFYRDGLGFKPHNYKAGEDHVLFAMEGTWLALFPRNKLAEDARVTDERPGFSGIALAHNVSSKEAVDEIYAFAVKAGAKPTKNPQPTFWGGYSGYFADPDGHLWEVAYNPFIDLT